MPVKKSPCPSRDKLGTGSLEKGEIQRIGHLEEQCLLGGELAVEEPARMLISILSKFLPKDEVFEYMKEYYSKNEFNLLWNQLQQKFNCMVSSSASGVLDAVSILLGFCENKRKYKHYPVKMLEESSKPVSSMLQPIIYRNKTGKYILSTTELFKYLTENLGADKSQLGYIAQRYIIEGLHEIVKRYDGAKQESDSLRESDSATYPKIFFSGGLSANRVMKEFAEEHGIYVSAKIPPGDEGIALGQIVYSIITPSA